MSRVEKRKNIGLRSRLNRTTAFTTIAMLIASTALANPQGGTVVEGSATIVQETVDKLVINQTTGNAVIDWQSFSIGANEHTHFNQPSSTSHTLNRVTGSQVSQILGKLTANGRVTLVNPNGVFFGQNSTVDVSALIASTHNITNSDFMADRLNFTIAGNPNATVINEGLINVQDGGLVALVAPSVGNSGLIQARLGKIVLAASAQEPPLKLGYPRHFRY